MTKTVRISDELAAFVDHEVASGHYNSADDVLSAALDLLEERSEKLTALRAALIEGEESGSAGTFNLSDFLEEMHRSRAPVK